MNILIIEDEHKAARELERILLEIDANIFITSIIDSVESGIDYFLNKPHPDLIFSDIQLADGICFEIFSRVKLISPIVFCTAFDEYAIEAFDTNAISYLLKPITSEKVAAAINKFHQMKIAFEPAKFALSINKIANEFNYSYKTALLVDHREKIIPLQVKDIAYFYLDKTIVNIITLTNQKYVMSSSLDEIERLLDPKYFHRANRQFLVNRTAIANVERYFSRKLVAKLMVDTSESIVVSKAKATDFLKWLEGE